MTKKHRIPCIIINQIIIYLTVEDSVPNAEKGKLNNLTIIFKIKGLNNKLKSLL